MLSLSIWDFVCMCYDFITANDVNFSDCVIVLTRLFLFILFSLDSKLLKDQIMVSVFSSLAEIIL